MTPNDRMNDMLSRYGEVCTRAQAARILGRSPKTVRAMLADGRLAEACAGEMVDVRSIAAYITAPRQADFEAKVRRSGRVWAV
jgi:hypothetical protein